MSMSFSGVLWAQDTPRDLLSSVSCKVTL